MNPIHSERLSELQSNIQRLKAELQTESGKECHVELKEEIAYWKEEIKKLKRKC